VIPRVTFECQEERLIPARDEERTREVDRREERQVYLYFIYSTPRLDAQRSAAPLAQLRTYLSEGYRVASVHGFTSPEGTQGPSRNFEGNIELSRERAREAVNQARQACTDPSGNCFENADTTGVGQSELYTLEEVDANGQVREVGGTPRAEAAQADYAAQQFSTSEAEAPHRTPDVERRLERARTSQQRAAIVYPLLRRAAINLARTRRVTETYMHHIPEFTQTRYVEGGCPTRILNAAFPPSERSGSTSGPGPRR